MYQNQEPKVIGILIDISQKHGKNQKKNLDNVKSALNEFMNDNFENDDRMYFYHPEIIDSVSKVGMIVSYISNYKTDGWKFEVAQPLKQTLFVVACEPYAHKTVLFITDRLLDPKPLELLAKFNSKDDLGCEIVCVDIGRHLSLLDGVCVVSVDDSTDLIGNLEEIIYGKHVSCTANRDTE